MNKYLQNAPLKKGLRYDGLEALNIATSRLNNPAEAPALFEAMVKYGDHFVAFFLGTKASELEPNALVETFLESFVLEASDERTAHEGVSYVTGLHDGARAGMKLKTDDQVELPAINSRTLQRRHEAEYVFVSLFSACYVFDARVIRNSLNR